ncbi:RluA family pseudouridine synthase [Candidatus Saccharibacteria bacterium]|nr:RluA family pseudouridine synthase [Candidatus Saccharibacteria bacterium]
MIITGKKFSKPEMSRVKNGDIELAEAPEKAKRKRLDHILVELHPEFNRSTLQNFIKSGYVTVGDKIIKKPNADIELDEEDNPPEIKLDVPKREVPPDAKGFTIYEDDNVLVLNKPAGMLSMKKGEWTPEITLEDYGLIVHRLDRDTSGVVILGKNPAVQSNLRKQFQDRKTHKTYYAIVEGKPKLAAAKIDLPIARNIKHPTTFLVDPNGKSSQTFYKILKTVEKTEKGKQKTYSLLELKPVTGRTHQLRVHLKYLGCPIVGDPIYGSSPRSSRKPEDRLYLHAHSLEITIPGTDGTSSDRRVFEAPLPEDFTKFLKEN